MSSKNGFLWFSGKRLGFFFFFFFFFKKEKNLMEKYLKPHFLLLLSPEKVIYFTVVQDATAKKFFSDFFRKCCFFRQCRINAMNWLGRVSSGAKLSEVQTWEKQKKEVCIILKTATLNWHFPLINSLDTSQGNLANIFWKLQTFWN